MTNPAAVASQINYLESLIAGYASTLRDPTSSPQQKSQAQREIPQLELTIASLRTQLTQLSLTVASDAGVVPPPPRTAGQTVNDDAVPNPIKPLPLEADPTTGRIRPIKTVTEPSNADVPSTAETGDVDRNIDGPVNLESLLAGHSLTHLLSTIPTLMLALVSGSLAATVIQDCSQEAVLQYGQA
jgi:hypothetical protein